MSRSVQNVIPAPLHRIGDVWPEPLLQGMSYEDALLNVQDMVNRNFNEAAFRFILDWVEVNTKKADANLESLFLGASNLARSVCMSQFERQFVMENVSRAKFAIYTVLQVYVRRPVSDGVVKINGLFWYSKVSELIEEATKALGYDEIVGLKFHYVDCSLLENRHKTLAEIGITGLCTVTSWFSLKGDIGIFDTHEDKPGTQYLCDGTLLAKATAADAAALLAEFSRASKDGEPIFGKEPIFSQEQCECLIGMIPAAGEDCDLKVPLTADELIDAVGREAYLRLMQAFAPAEGSKVSFWLRVVTATGQCINMHTDHAQKTMQVFLNDECKYEGARTVFVTGGKGFLQAPSRAPGNYSIHEWDVLHGVTLMVSGIRISFFVLQSE